MNLKKAIYRFGVHLRDVKPEVWRTIEVPATYSFWDLHVAIQDSMGWQDCHLHEFRVSNPESGEVEEIGIPDEDSFDDDPETLPGWEVPIAGYFTKKGDRADYMYDFGDGWEHDIILEEIEARTPRTRYPRCLAGARACPPEDCGGSGGYESLLKIASNPSHKGHEEALEWLGEGFDPEHFDPKEVRFDKPAERLEIALFDE